MKSFKDKIIIGIDHGYGNIKTANPELFTPLPDNRLNNGKPLIKMKNRLSPKR